MSVEGVLAGRVGVGGQSPSASPQLAGNYLVQQSRLVKLFHIRCLGQAGWKPSPGAQKPPGASPTPVPVNAPAVLLMQPPVLGQIEAAILDHVPSLISPRTFPGLVRSHPEL